MLPGTTARISRSSDDAQFARLFSVSRLASTAAALRREVKLVGARDAVDWTDWFSGLSRSLPALSSQIIDGSYRPSTPTRYEYPKSKGSFRTLTVPNIRDTLVYRHLADEALKRALPRKVKGAFFSRRHTPTPVGPTFELDHWDPYHKFFTIWLTYNQYRTKTLLNQPHDVLVTTDISNFFDSIQHDLLLEYLAPLGLPRKAVGLLGRLLEVLKPQAGHSPNPRVGLPQDEFDASRELAYMFLFEHDHRVADYIGEERYVRWLDDQNIGTTSHAHARRVVNFITRSLEAQRLTLNAGKTVFLTPDEVVVHFQLHANDLLDQWDQSHRAVRGHSPPMRRSFRQLWRQIERSGTADKGNWDKILKRSYGLATRADSGVLESRALKDLITYPEMADRIFLYFARRNRAPELLDVFEEYFSGGESLFEWVEAAFFEAAMLIDAAPEDARRLHSTARRWIADVTKGRTRPLPGSAAILLLYWLGERPSVLVRLFDADTAPLLPKEIARSWLACATARKPEGLSNVRALLLGHPADDVARLARFLTDLTDGDLDNVGRFHQKPRNATGDSFYDVRSWLMLEIAANSPNVKLRQQLLTLLPRFGASAATSAEQRVLRRVRRLLR